MKWYAPKTKKGIVSLIAVIAIVTTGVMTQNAKAWAPYDTGLVCRDASTVSAKRELCERRTEFFSSGFYWQSYYVEWRSCIMDYNTQQPTYRFLCYPDSKRTYLWYWNGSIEKWILAYQG